MRYDLNKRLKVNNIENHITKKSLSCSSEEINDSITRQLASI